MPVLLAVAASAAPAPQAPGVREGACRPHAEGVPLRVEVVGLKDRRGLLRAELYPPTDADFLADDTDLLRAGRTFRRVETPVPSANPVLLCILVPRPGRYALVVHHDRDANRRFGVSKDGVGFGSNPRLGWGRPKVAQAIVDVPAGGDADTKVVINYLSGLRMRPLRDGGR